MADSDIHRKLFDAVGDDSDDTRVRELLAAGADPHKYRDRRGWTVLIEAAWRGRDSAVFILIQNGADLNIQNNYGSSALYCAAGGRGNNKVITTLIEAGADLNIQNKVGKTALHNAAENGSNEVITALIKAGADLNIQSKIGWTALYYAAANGLNKVTTTLIEAGADLNIQNNEGWTALAIAASSGHIDIVTTLMKAGADLKIQNKHGDTVMHRAAVKGNNEVTTKWIWAGADLNIQNKNGKTALHNAAEKGSNEVTTTLIEARADLNIQTKNGETALYMAAGRGHNEVATSLIKAGADLNIQTKDGETALTVAASSGHIDVVTTLIEAGAEVPPSFYMINKDPSFISSVLDFLSKKLDKIDDYQNKDDYQKIKDNLGIETTVEGKKTMFYLVRSQEYDRNRNLLEYIDTQNVRLIRQREELIDLSVKIANLNHRDDTEKAMEEVINHYKSGLPSGEGLRDMIAMIKERYPWPTFKKIIMILLSLVTCLLGIGLFVFDLTTDVQFSVEMFNKENKSITETEDFETLSKKLNEFNFSSPDSLNSACNAYIDFYKNYSNLTILDYEDFDVTGLISLWSVPGSPLSD